MAECIWCKQTTYHPSSLKTPLCDICAKGWDAAQKWASQQPDPAQEAKARKSRLEAVTTMNNIIPYAPPITCRLSRNSKGVYKE